MKKIANHILVALLGLGIMFSAQAGSLKPDELDNEEEHKMPSGKGWGEPVLPSSVSNYLSTAVIPQNGIQFHGGPVLGVSTVPNIYYIWYGNWTNDPGVSILTDLAKNIGSSAYYTINSTYTDKYGIPIKSATGSFASYIDNYSGGTTLSDPGVLTVVTSAISKGKLPISTNAIYFVLASSDVKESSGFCTKYCGWHSSANIKSGKSTVNIKYAFVGNPSQQCPNSCEAQTTASPNNNPGADAMASVVAHEISEAVTDPNLNAWYETATGYENADKCSWKFGQGTAVGNGSLYNTIIGTRAFYIQQNWVNVGTGYCGLQR